jgi:hypothetical protein
MEPDESLSRVTPPLDPEEWTDEQWLSWLKSSDNDDADSDEYSVETVVKRIVTSSAGQVLGQAMMGLSQAIYGRKDEELVIVVEGDGEPADDEAFTIQLDFEHPERSSVTFRSNDKPPA